MRYTFARRRAIFTRVVLSLGLILSLVISVSAPVFAAGGIQGNLTGTVQDQTTHKPIANVQVTADSPSGKFTGVTDASGSFTLLGLPPDTYAVSLEKSGYGPISIPGVAVFGDQTNTIGVVYLKTEIRTIARITSRARNGAFQPTQTQDTTTISGARITQALGNAQSNNEQNLILAAPGAMLDAQNNITVRGSLSTELGYQYDGVDFTVPFFDGNASAGYINNIAGGSGGELQVVSGSGDATQGNIGAGVINIVPPRGTYPANGNFSAMVGSPFFQHELDFNYGWATPDNRFSDYFSYDGSRNVPQYAPFGADASAIGQYYGTSYTKHDDVQNNFVFRFGHNRNMSLQWLFRTQDQQQWGNYGGINNAQYYPYDPFAYSSWNWLFPGYTFDPTGASSLQQYQNDIFLMPGVPTTGMQPNSPEETLYQPLSFNKLGYTWNINGSTFMNLEWANMYQVSGGTNYIQGAAFGPALTEIGGQRIFGEADLTHQFGSNHTTTLALRYEDALPRWHEEAPWWTTMTMSLYDQTPAGLSVIPESMGLPPNAPAIEDWYLPFNPGQPVDNNAGDPNYNPCVGGFTGPGAGGVVADPNGCYIYDYMLANGLWKGTLPRIPTQGIDYHHSIFHESGIGIRDQWTVNPRLNFDYGLRIDIDHLAWGTNPYGGPTAADAASNPSDVNAATKLGNDFLRPSVLQPRFAASYRLSTNDSLRFSYGRSVDFFFAQTAGTPFDMQNVPGFFFKMPAKESAAGQALLGFPATAQPPACGSGTNLVYKNSTGYLGNQWPCSNYAQSIFWAADQIWDAPDLGGQGPPTYNNWDLAWGHQFTKGLLDGFGVKLTGFARRGYNVEQNTLIANGPPNPVTGQTSAAVFQTNANGVEKTYGLEFMLTSPDRPTGLSGFLTMNYISEWGSTPPVDLGNFGNDQLPILFGYEFNAGQLYRSNFLPPFQGRLGLVFKTKGGVKINPIFAFDGGYPIGVGRNTYAGILGGYAWVPETNFGAATPLGGPNGPGNPYNASYFVDPQNPGSYFNPNIAASRGYNEPALPGGALTRPHGNFDLDLEYSPHGSPLTFGLYVADLMNNHYGLWYPNQQYQAVATGVAGPQTGQFPGAYPGSVFYNAGTRDNFPLTCSTCPFQVPYGPPFGYPGRVLQFYLTSRI